VPIGEEEFHSLMHPPRKERESHARKERAEERAAKEQAKARQDREQLGMFDESEPVQPHRLEAEPPAGGPKTPHEWAVYYRSLGISGIPLRADGSKAPVLSEWSPFQKGIASEEQLTKWFKGKELGIGLVCGAVSGCLTLFEVETPEVRAELEDAMREHGLEEILGKLTLRVISGGGGTHYWYRCQEAPMPSKCLARKPKDETLPPGVKPKLVKIEVRGEGGYGVAPGSAPWTHPTGNPYRIESGTFDDIPVLSEEEQAALLAIATSLDEDPRQQFKEPGTLYSKIAKAVGDEGVRPGDDFNAQADTGTILEMLEHAGWHSSRNGRHGVQLTRPGKNSGVSGSILYPSERCPFPIFYCFTSSSSHFEPGEAYTPFALSSILLHGGDFGSAARELRKVGYGGADGFSTNSATQDPIRQGVEAEGYDQAPGGFPPISQASTRGEGVEFRGGSGEEEGPEKEAYCRVAELVEKVELVKNPLSTPSDPLRMVAELVENPKAFPFQPMPPPVLPGFPKPPGRIEERFRFVEYAEASRCPIEITALVQLSVLATCFQRRAEVLYAGDTKRGKGYSETLSLWTVFVAGSGGRKTSGLEALSKPLNEAIKDLKSEKRLEHRKWREKVEVLKSRVSEARRNVDYGIGKGTSQAPRGEKASLSQGDFDYLIEELHKAEEAEVFVPKVMVTEATPEAIDKALRESDGRISVFDDEGRLVAKLTNPRSQSSSAEGNLNGHYSGSTFHFERKSTGKDGAGESYTIERPACTLCLGLQPPKLDALLDHDSMRDAGFFARCLISNVPFVRPDFETPDSSHLARWWGSLVQEAWSSFEAPVAPGHIPLLRFSDEAASLIGEFHEEVYDRIEHSNLPRSFRNKQAFDGWLSKAVGQAQRIAAILHLGLYLRPGLDREIEVETTRYALDIVRYHKAHMEAILGLANGPVWASAAPLLRFLEDQEKARGLLDSLNSDLKVTRGALTEVVLRPLVRPCTLDPALAALERLGWVRKYQLPASSKEGTGGRPSTHYSFAPEAVEEIKRIGGLA